MKQFTKRVALVLFFSMLFSFVLCGCDSDSNESDIQNSENQSDRMTETESFDSSDTEGDNSSDTENTDSAGKDYVEGIGGSDNDLDDFTLEPQIMLTFKTDIDHVQTVLLKKGGESRTFQVPDSFCLAAEKEKADYWVPIDTVTFKEVRLKSGDMITLDYDEARKMFGVSFKGTVIKMIGKRKTDDDEIMKSDSAVPDFDE